MSKMPVRLFAILVTLTFVSTIPVLAKNQPLPLTIVQTVKLGDTQLSPGDYTVVVDGNTLTLEHGKKVMATVTGHWEDQKTKASATEYDSSNGSVTKLYFHGEARAFIPGQ